MKACVLHAIGDLRYEDVPTPSPRAGEALIAVRACGVCGSDIPRVFEKGTYQFPAIPGHEFSGEVVAVGPGVDAEWVGKAVAVFPLIPCRACGPCEIGAFAQCEDYNYLGSRCDGAFAEFVCAPAWNLLRVPDGVSYEVAAMVEPAAVAIHALRQAGIDMGDRVAIFGAGPIGVMLALWARLWGASKVMLIDIEPRKLDFARSMGFEELFNPRQSGDVTAWVQNLTEHGADLVIEASGSSVAFEQSVLCARTFGTVVLMGNPAGDMKLSQKAYWAILRNELRLHGTWNSSYCRLPKNEWQLALDHMASGRLDVLPLVTHRVGLDSLADALVLMRDRLEFSNKILYVAPDTTKGEV